jgi:Homeodomain-like domain
MGAEKNARDLHIATLAMQGVPVGEIARRLRIHRNTVCRRLKRPQTRQYLAVLLQDSELTPYGRNTRFYAALRVFAIFTFTVCSTWFVMTRNRSACCS